MYLLLVLHKNLENEMYLGFNEKTKIVFFFGSYFRFGMIIIYCLKLLIEEYLNVELKW